METSLNRLPQEEKQSALLRILKATMTLSAQTTLYASALGFLVLSAGGSVTNALLTGFLTSVGVEAFSDILIRVARGKADDKAIQNAVKTAIEQSRIASAFDNTDFQQALAKLLKEQQQIQAAIFNAQTDVSKRLEDQYKQFAAIAPVLVSLRQDVLDIKADGKELKQLVKQIAEKLERRGVNHKRQEVVRVFVSSTAKDLEVYRSKVLDALRALDMFPIAMEDFVASNHNALQYCYDQMQKADLFIGIYAHRYGFSPSENISFTDTKGNLHYGDNQTSITEWEYRFATEKQIPILAFIVSSPETNGISLDWPPADIEGEPGKSRLQALRKAIMNDRVVSFFSSPDDLAKEVVISVSRHIDLFSSTAIEGLRPQIRAFVDAYTAIFGGRSEELASLDNWLQQSEQRLGTLIAPAGYGKSALIANWVELLKRSEQAVVAYYPVSNRYQTNTREDLLITLVEDIKRARKKPIAWNYSELESRSLANELIAELRKPFESNLPLVVVIDGLDELDTAPLDILNLPQEIGTNVFLLLAMRGDPQEDTRRWLTRLNWDTANPRHFQIGKLRVSEVEEVLDASGIPFDAAAKNIALNTLYHLSEEGDALTLSLYINELRRAFDTTSMVTVRDFHALELDRRNPGINAYLSNTIELLDRSGIGSHDFSKAFFEALCMAFGPLSRKDLDALGVDISSVSSSELITLSRGLIIETSEKFALGHSRIGYAYQQESRFPFAVRNEWIEKFRRYGKSTLEDLKSGRITTSEVSDYLLRFYGVHLVDDRITVVPSDVFELVSPIWMQAHLDRFKTYDSFLADVSRAWELANEVGAAQVKAGNPVDVMSFQIKCMTCFSSVIALADRLPAALPALLQKDNLWTKSQAFAYVNRIPDDLRRCQARLFLLQNSSEMQHLDAKTTIDAYDRDRLTTDILSDLERLEDKEESAIRATLLIDLIPFLNDASSYERAIKIAKGIGNKISRAHALSVILSGVQDQTLKASLIDELITVTSAISYDVYSEEIAYTPYLFQKIADGIDISILKNVWDQLLCSKAIEIENFRRAYSQGNDYYFLRRFFDGLAWHIPDHKAMAFVQMLWEFDNILHISQRIVRLAHHLSDTTALEIARDLQAHIMQASDGEFIVVSKHIFIGCGLPFVALAMERTSKEHKAAIVAILRWYIDTCATDVAPLTKGDLEIFHQYLVGSLEDVQLATRIEEGSFLVDFVNTRDASYPFQELAYCLGPESIKALFDGRNDDCFGGLPYLLPIIASKLSPLDLRLIFAIGGGAGSSWNVGYVRAITDTARTGKLVEAGSEFLQHTLNTMMSLFSSSIPMANKELAEAIAPYVTPELIETAEPERTKLIWMAPRLSQTTLYAAIQWANSKSYSDEYMLPLMKHLSEHDRKHHLKLQLEKHSQLVDFGETLELLKSLSHRAGVVEKIQISAMDRVVSAKGIDGQIAEDLKRDGIRALFVPYTFYYRPGLAYFYPHRLIKILVRQYRALFHVLGVLDLLMEYRNQKTQLQSVSTDNQQFVGFFLRLITSSGIYWRFISAFVALIILLILPISMLATTLVLLFKGFWRTGSVLFATIKKLRNKE